MKEKDINNAIIGAIDILVNRALELSNFNTTIYGIIEEPIDDEHRGYKIKYQDSSIIAYSNIEKEYKPGTGVYILVTNGNINNTKFILGSIQKDCFKEEN
jgi:hypothetical protein